MHWLQPKQHDFPWCRWSNWIAQCMEIGQGGFLYFYQQLSLCFSHFKPTAFTFRPPPIMCTTSSKEYGSMSCYYLLSGALSMVIFLYETSLQQISFLLEELARKLENKLKVQYLCSTTLQCPLNLRKKCPSPVESQCLVCPCRLSFFFLICCQSVKDGCNRLVRQAAKAFRLTPYVFCWLAQWRFDQSLCGLVVHEGAPGVWKIPYLL